MKFRLPGRAWNKDLIRGHVVYLEKAIASAIGREIEDIRAFDGDKMAHEVLASVACLFAARAAALIHVWTGEPIDAVRKRIFENFDEDLKSSLKKITAVMAKGEG